MNGVQSSFWDAFGMHDPKQGGQLPIYQIAEENRNRLLGYIPLIGGQYQAVGHWKKVYEYNNRDFIPINSDDEWGLGYRVGLVVRGIFEFLGLGLVLLLTLDLVTTVARVIKGCMEKKTSEQEEDYTQF